MLVPCTSRGKGWKSLEESFLYRRTHETAISTNREAMGRGQITFKWFLAVDPDEEIYTQENCDKAWPHESFDVTRLRMEVPGDICFLWNWLFRHAFEAQCDYFYQVGDDIQFYESSCENWVMRSINLLVENMNVGITGPVSHHTILKLTQAMVSRLHFKIFGYFFPPSFRNFGVDQWSNQVYQGKDYMPIEDAKYMNVSGTPRYDTTVYNGHYSVWDLRVRMGRKEIKNWKASHPIILLIGAKPEGQIHYPAQRIAFFPCDATNLDELDKLREEILCNPKLFPDDAVVMFSMSYAHYDPMRIPVTAHAFADGITDVVGCWEVPVLQDAEDVQDAGKRKREDDPKLVYLRGGRFNDVFKETLAFTIGFWRHHHFKWEGHASDYRIDKSFVDYAEYPVKILNPTHIIQHLLQAGHSGLDPGLWALERCLGI